VTEDQLPLLETARDSITAARLLLNSGFPGFAASRAYYAMFYVAEALLEGEGLSFSKHSAVISAFGQHFAHSGKVPVEFHRRLLEAQTLRLAGDYDPNDAVTHQQAEDQIKHAEQFLDVAQKLIGRLP
jgi:uncharacterized protein (UPF0332 family)